MLKKTKADQDEVCIICMEDWSAETDEEEPWIECELCKSWLHASCAGYGEKSAEELCNMTYTCDSCKHT